MENNIYQAAIQHYGKASQEDKLIEEMAELMQAILKVRRLGENHGPLGKQNTWGNLHEEFADVKIVMAQLETTLDAALLAQYTNDKLTKLQGLLEQGDKDTNKY